MRRSSRASGSTLEFHIIPLPPFVLQSGSMSLLRRRNFWLGAGLLVAAAAAGAVYVLPPWPSFLNIVFDVMAFAVTLLGGLALISQFVLPVQNSRERRKVFDHFMNFVTGQAGPVLFVKDGQLVGAKDELRRYG